MLLCLAQIPFLVLGKVNSVLGLKMKKCAHHWYAYTV